MIRSARSAKGPYLTRTRKVKSDLRRLPTEQGLPAATDLDRMSSLEIVGLMNREDATVAAAVGRALRQRGARVRLGVGHTAVVVPEHVQRGVPERVDVIGNYTAFDELLRASVLPRVGS